MALDNDGPGFSDAPTHRLYQACGLDMNDAADRQVFRRLEVGYPYSIVLSFEELSSRTSIDDSQNEAMLAVNVLLEEVRILNGGDDTGGDPRDAVTEDAVQIAIDIVYRQAPEESQRIYVRGEEGGSNWIIRWLICAQLRIH